MDAQKTKFEKMAAARQGLKTCNGASKRGKSVVQSQLVLVHRIGCCHLFTDVVWTLDS